MINHYLCLFKQLVFVLLCLVVPAAAWGNEDTTGLALKLDMEKTRVTASEPIWVRVELLNTGHTPVQLYSNFVLEYHFLAFEIKDQDGKYAEFLGPIHKLRPESFTVVDLLPQAFIGQHINLRHGENMNRFNQGKALYRIDKKGRYTVRAIYNNVKTKGPWRGKLESNQVEFIVE
jgi:hypothetical protein